VTIIAAHDRVDSGDVIHNVRFC